MMWLTWRQFRAQAIGAAAVLALTTVLLGLTGRHVAYLYQASGAAGCAASHDCGSATTTFLDAVNATLSSHLPLLFGTALIVVPAILGMFWGAPLVTRELETGTHRLVWSQSVSRAAWLAIKLGVIVAIAMATAGVFSLLVTWSAGPIDQVNQNLLQPSVFSERGIAPIGYAAFAVALGVLAGILIRRTVPAMAFTLVAFTVIQFAMRALRQYLVTPVRLISPLGRGDILTAGVQHGADGAAHTILTGNANIPGAWVLSTQVINAAGQVVGGVTRPAAGNEAARACAGPHGPARSCFAQLASRGYRQLVTYQPASRFWEFQWYETAIFLALAAGMAGASFWWIRRRVS